MDAAREEEISICRHDSTQTAISAGIANKATMQNARCRRVPRDGLSISKF